ncbi:MAG: hypothetical protein MUF15_27380 [Acidobacteria bacterium]|jgi:hypothetical protein|nr:hypothetical protein [Acidobacteriota bacterium]
MKWTIEFYKTKTGKIPVKEFLDSLNPRQAANVIEKIPNKELAIAKKRMKEYLYG